MRVVLKKNVLFSSGYWGKEFYIVPNDRSSSNVQDHINAWLNGGSGDVNQRYAQELQDSQAWKIVASKDTSHGSWPSTPLVASAFDVVDAEDEGDSYQITCQTGIDGVPAYRGVLWYGKIIKGVVTRDSRHLILTSGPSAGQAISMGLVATPKDTVVNPYKEVTVKVLENSTSDILQYMPGYFVKVAHNPLVKTGNVYLTHPTHATVRVSPSSVQFPETEEQAQMFDRKATVGYGLVLHERLKETINTHTGAFNSPLAYMQHEEGSSIQLYNYGSSLTNYWDVDTKDFTKATFLPQGKVAAALAKGEDPWTSTMRQSTSWAKLIRGQMNPKVFRESQFENFGTSMVAALGQLYGPPELRPAMVVVSGPDIAKYYSQDYYIEKKGDLGGSCMRHVSPTFFDMYTKNPDNISMLIIKDNKKDAIYGRAILWLSDEGIKYIDRRYTVAPVESTKMMNWAKENGYIDLWGGHHSPKAGVKVTLKNPYHKLYPYMDSMCHLDVDTGVLSSVPPSGKKVSMVKDTSGHRSTLNHEVPCAVSEIYAPKDKMKQTVSGQYGFPEFLEEIRGKRFELKKLVVQDTLEGGKISSSESIKLTVDGVAKIGTRCSNKVVMTTGGAFMLKEQAVYSKHLGAFIPVTSAVTASDGTYCTKESIAIYEAKLAQKKPNKARMVVSQPAVAAVAV